VYIVSMVIIVRLLCLVDFVRMMTGKIGLSHRKVLSLSNADTAVDDNALSMTNVEDFGTDHL